MSEGNIRVRRTLMAPPERVFELWTRPEFISRWFGGLETEVRGVALDLRPGGRYSIKVITEAGPSTISGEFLEVDPPQRLVYTWELASPQGEIPVTTVEVEFQEQGNGTQVVLNHGPFFDPKPKAFHSDGWQECFSGLESMITGG